MSIFEKEDAKTVRIIGLTGIGFAVLTVALIVISLVVT